MRRFLLMFGVILLIDAILIIIGINYGYDGKIVFKAECQEKISNDPNAKLETLNKVAVNEQL